MLFAIVPLSKGFFTVISPEDEEWASQYTWYAWDSHGEAVYAVRKDGDSNIYMHRELLGLEAGEIGDHINGLSLDNRRCNLRKVTKSENMRNRGGGRKDNRSGFLGVSKHGMTGRWQASIWYDGKGHYLGLFDTPEEANQARLAEERIRWGIAPRRAQAHAGE